MIDISKINPSQLHATPIGALFIPSGGQSGHFLAGRVGVAVGALEELDGDPPFELAETDEWQRPPGVLIVGDRFQVEPTAAVAVTNFHDARVGTILITPAGPMLVARNSRGEKRAVQFAEPIRRFAAN